MLKTRIFPFLYSFLISSGTRKNGRPIFQIYRRINFNFPVEKRISEAKVQG